MINSQLTSYLIIFYFFQDIIAWHNRDPVAFRVISLDSIKGKMNVDINRETEVYTELCIRLLRWSPNACPSKPSIPIYRIISIDVPNVKDCFLMSLLNLAAPSWKRVNCNEPLIAHVFCQIEENTILNTDLVKAYPGSKSCIKGSILKSNNCYLFTWHKLGERLLDNCQSNTPSVFQAEKFQFLFDAVSDILPPLFSPDFKDIITYKRHWNTYSYNYTYSSDYTKEEGMYICVGNKSVEWKGNHVFRCDSGVYISYKLVCDGKYDCPGHISVDEVGCKCNTTFNYTSQCKISLQTKQCSDFYFKTMKNTCMLYDFTLDNYKISNKIIKKILMDTHKWNERKKRKLSCFSNDLLKYIFYEVSPICSYRLNAQGHLLPCNKGEHLQNCKPFECDVLFKCPGYYCIPWGYICDGKCYCPSGYDESSYHNCANRTCINMYKCKMSPMCINLGDVFDENFDCPQKDDEYLCLLKGLICPSLCQCLAFAIRCYEIRCYEII